MTVLTRWDPLRDVATMQNRLNRFVRELYSPEGPEEALTTTGFAPPVDVYEDEHNITLKIEVPGIDEKDIDVRIENNTLTVHGERKFEKEEKDKKYHRIERSYGNFLRSFTLPDGADGSKASAEFQDGVLKVHLPKSEKAKPKAVEVKVT